MNIKGIICNTIRRLQVSFFPSEQDKEVRRYLSDGGDEALRSVFDIDENSLVLDFGGFQGQWASDIYARYNCQIFIFEPVKIYAHKISRRFINNPKIQVFDIALGGKNREEIMGLCDDSSSQFKKSANKVVIKFEDVADFFDKHNIKTIDLIKINIEGGEYELFDRLFELDLIKNIKQIHVQFHNVGNDSEFRMKKICSELSKTHKATYQYKFVWENWVRHEV